MSADWDEVRRSVPAEFVRGVPDRATVYACWIDRNSSRSVTVYHDADQNAYDVVLHACGVVQAVHHHDEERRAIDRAKRIRREYD